MFFQKYFLFSLLLSTLCFAMVPLYAEPLTQGQAEVTQPPQEVSQSVQSPQVVALPQQSHVPFPMPGWREPFEESAPSWRLLHSANGAKLAVRQRVDEAMPPSNQSLYTRPSNEAAVRLKEQSEFLLLDIPTQSDAVLGHTIGFPLLIEDLDPVLRIKSDRPGIAIGVQVVLPHTIHSKTGKPLTYLVVGDKYKGSHDWEHLKFRDKTGEPNLAHQADHVGRLLRAELQAEGWAEKFDTRDRYVRQVLLFVEGDTVAQTQARLWIDRLDAGGYMQVSDQHINKFELSDAGCYGFRFDPINFVGFKILAGSQCHFLQSYSAKSAVGYTEWTSQFAGSCLTPLEANGPNYTTPRSAEEDARHRTLFNEQQVELRFSLMNRHDLTPGVSPTSLVRIQLRDRILHIDDVPIGVRAIEYRGEPLAFLRKLEFNTIWVKGQPSPELLLEARNVGLWLICSPPGPSELNGAKRFNATQSNALERITASNAPVIDSVYDNVLAWNIGDECTSPDHPVYAQWATVLQGADRVKRRPILCTPRSGVREYSRIVDILVMDRPALLSSLDLNDLATWQKSYQSLARPDTPFWCTVQTDPDPRLANQWILYGGNAQDIIAITHEHIKMQVLQALAIGSHGFLFTSNTPLTNNDPATEYRRTSLELINWELQMLDEWFASGKSRPSPIKASRKGKMASAVLQSRRTRLMLPIWTERESQLAVGGAVEGETKYIVSGVPETYLAFNLVPGRLYPLKTERVAGGTEVTIDEASLNSLIYFGERDEAYASIERNAKEIGPRAAYLACRLAEMQLASTKQVLSLLKQAREAGAIPDHPEDKLPLIPVREYESDLKTIKEAIEQAKQSVQQAPVEYAMAYLLAERATRGLRVQARDLLRQTTRHDLNPCMKPVSVSFATLPYYLAAYQRTLGAKRGPNRLSCGGTMEDVELWTQSGWAARRQRIDGIASPVVGITPSAKRSGLGGLRIVVQPTSPEEKPILLETEPLWIRTPPIPVRMGEMLCVSGWIRIPKTLESSVDGMLIFDSLGGEALALRFLQTKGTWKEFAFYRYVPVDGDYYVSFAMQGIGEVHLDDIWISSVDIAAPQPVLGPQQTTPTPWQRLNPLQYLPPFPNRGNP